ncbi:MAG: hypothetical protein ABEJ93_01945 [Candidatus Nanohalobium sp.]
MKKLFLAAALLLMVSATAAEGIGVTPSVKDIGTLQKGESRQVDLYLDLKGYDTPITVKPSYNRPMLDRLLGGSSSIRPSSYSGQDISPWISFSQDEYTVTPNASVEVGDRSFDGKITYTISVPAREAEPGYHAGFLELDTSSVGEGSGFGASFVAKGVHRFIFRVPGVAQRNIDYEARVLRTGPDQISVVARFVNRGTVTTLVRNTEFNLTNMNGNFSTSRLFGNVRVPAQGSETEVMQINSEKISAGNYRLSGRADYMTGVATESDSFSLSDVVEVRPEELEEQGPGSGVEDESLPMWLVIMTLVVVGVLMYSFGIDPIWIVAVVGIIGISLFIITSPVSNLLLIIFLFVSGALLYYGAM